MAQKRSKSRQNSRHRLEFRLKSGAASADWVKAEYDQAGGMFLANGGVQSAEQIQGVGFFVD